MLKNLHRSARNTSPVKLTPWSSRSRRTWRPTGWEACAVAFDTLWRTELSDSGRWPPQENLRHYVDRIFNVITTSGVRCPTVMCDIFFSLRESAATRFQGNEYIIVVFSSCTDCNYFGFWLKMYIKGLKMKWTEWRTALHDFVCFCVVLNLQLFLWT